MGNLKNIDFERCTSGIEFEGWVCDLLRKPSFPADRVDISSTGLFPYWISPIHGQMRCFTRNMA